MAGKGHDANRRPIHPTVSIANLHARDISADEGGLGIPICDRLAENGWRVLRVNNGSPADKPDAYANKGAEIWFEGRTLIEQQQIILPNDRELISQLTSRLGWPNSRGKLELESKSAMRARGLASPDRADAILGAIMPAPAAGGFQRVERERDWTAGWRDTWRERYAGI